MRSSGLLEGSTGKPRQVQALDLAGFWPGARNRGYAAKPTGTLRSEPAISCALHNQHPGRSARMLAGAPAARVPPLGVRRHPILDGLRKGPAWSGPDRPGNRATGKLDYAEGLLTASSACGSRPALPGTGSGSTGGP